MKNKGFTLIEILVVVAIIGILLGIITDFLIGARSKAKDARIKQTMTSLRTSMALYDTNHDGWPCNVFQNDNNIAGYWQVIYTDSGSNQKPTCGPSLGNSCYGIQDTAGCTVNGSSYTAVARLSDGSYWCIDSNQSGKRIAITTSLNPWSQKCP